MEQSVQAPVATGALPVPPPRCSQTRRPCGVHLPPRAMPPPSSRCNEAPDWTTRGRRARKSSPPCHEGASKRRAGGHCCAV